MSKNILNLSSLFCLGLIVLALGACSGKHAHDEHAEHNEHDEHTEHAEHHDHADLIELSDEQAGRFGVEVDTVRPADFDVAIRCSGVIERSAENAATAVAPRAGVVRLSPSAGVGAKVGRGASLARIDAAAVSGGDSNAAALAALRAAQREVDRLAPLYADKLVTATEYNAALAALDAARAAYSPKATSGSVAAPMAGVVTALLVADGAYVNAGDPIAEIASDSRLTLRAEVTADDYPRLATVTDARIGDFLLSAHGGKKGGVSAANGYGTIWFTFANDGTLMPGSGVETYLLGTSRSGVISVPAGAVTEQQGEHYVYLRHSPGHYVKQPVTLGASNGLRYEITSGLKGGEPVVTAGAITVRLAESSGAIPEGHSHNH